MSTDTSTDTSNHAHLTATFTLANAASGTHQTFSVKRAGGESHNRPWYVNNGDGNYLGCIWPATHSSPPKFTRTKGTKVDDDHVSMRTFRWLEGRLLDGEQSWGPVQFWHRGKCCRCGSAMSDPADIAVGIDASCQGAS
jgi:hypothetical protein